MELLWPVTVREGLLCSFGWLFLSFMNPFDFCMFSLEWLPKFDCHCFISFWLVQLDWIQGDK